MNLRQLCFPLLLGSALHAQSPARTVSGVVFDSIAGGPLRGAIVQVAWVDAPARGAPAEWVPRVFSAATDSVGRYRITGLPEGRFAIGFQHDALNAMGLESPLGAFVLAGDRGVTVNLAVPNGPAVRDLLCGTQARLAGEGLLAGYVIDAGREGMLSGAVVTARWLELALERSNYRAVARTVTAITGADGRYLACGLTSEEAVRVEVSMPGFRGISHHLSIPNAAAARQDFRLADSGVNAGLAGVVGRVLLPDGSALAAGQALVGAIGREVPIRNGEFVMSHLPAGTWAVEVRAIGHEPRAALVDLPAAGVVATTITIGDRTRVLGAITVRGTRGGDDRILRAIASRRSTSTGSVFLPGDPYLASSYDPADVVRSAPGFRYVSAEVLLSSGCSFRYPPADEPAMPSGTVRARTRTLAVYLDGARVVGGLPELRTSVTMRDILAIEAYQDISTAPLEWRTNDACSVLAIWTKRDRRASGED